MGWAARPPPSGPGEFGVSPSPRSRALSVPLPLPRERLGISAGCPQEPLFSEAKWVMAGCRQRWLWESSKTDLRFHTASLQPRQPDWALKNPLFYPSGQILYDEVLCSAFFACLSLPAFLSAFTGVRLADSS